MGLLSYGHSAALMQALEEDVSIRFSTLVKGDQQSFPKAVAGVDIDLIEQMAEFRNLARF